MSRVALHIKPEWFEEYIVPELNTALVPQVSHEARRRKYDATPWLIRKNDWYRLDPIGDSIWCAYEEGLSIAAASARVAREHNLPLHVALASAIFDLARHQALGLIEQCVDMQHKSERPK